MHCPEQRQSEAQRKLGDLYALREKRERFGTDDFAGCGYAEAVMANLLTPRPSAYDDPILGPLMRRADEEEKKGEPPRFSLLW